MPTWNEFAWSTFLFWAMSDRNRSYQRLMNNHGLLNTLWNNPGALSIEQIREYIVGRFLNVWQCRLERSDTVAQAIKDQLVQLHPCLNALGAYDVETVDFGANIFVDEHNISVSQACEKCYNTLRHNINHRFAGTATSKLLHLLEPGLFVMWDQKILGHLRGPNPQIRDSGAGYCAFLRSMQDLAIVIHQAFDQQNDGQEIDPAIFLSEQLHYDQPQTLAKFIDEYNWITITKGITLPPPWHPG